MADDLETLLSTLDAEPEVEINYDAPESGSFPPQVYPGRHPFIFHLAAEPFDKMVVEGRPYLNVTFEAEIATAEKPEGVRVKFLRASFYKHPKMANSDGAELLRCLGIKADAANNRSIVAALQAADGRARGEAVIGWEAFSRDTGETASTNPRKKARKNGKVDIAWPKGADGRYTQTVTFPESGDSAYGKERIISFKLPSSNGV